MPPLHKVALAAALGALLALPAHAGRPPEDPDSGAEMLGRPAPAWSFTRWVSGPKSGGLGQFRGQVVLLRFWTEKCRYCRHTLPALEELRQRYEKQGLVVVGAFHPKPPREVGDAHIVATADSLGYHGRLAFDRDWQTLERYWLEGHPERNWTSVSFLIDRDGNVIWVHGGGEYHPSTDPYHHTCDADFRELEGAVEAALARAGAPKPVP
jgi:glutathione peroxidase-family protein